MSRRTMMITCPACSTRYVVPEASIGAEGRTVRCAKCRHSWFQEGALSPQQAAAAKTPTQPTASAPAVSEAAHRNQPVPAADWSAAPAAATTRARGEADWSEEPPASEPASSAATHITEPRHSAAPPSRPPEPAVYDYHDVDRYDESGSLQESYEDVDSPFDAAPPFRPRRNPLRFWTAAGVAFAALAIGTVGAVSYWGLPDWVPINRPVFAAGNRDLVLDFPPEQQDRRTLPNNTEFFGASGTITNVGRETVPVPSILIVMRDARERIVYSWEVAPPRDRLAPGEVMRIDEAVVDVPRSAKFAEIGWKPD